MDPTNSTSAAGLTVQVCFPGSRAAVMDNLNRQREEGRLCDLSIHVQGQVFRAHRCVLAASSPYFHDQVMWCHPDLHRAALLRLLDSLDLCVCAFLSNRCFLKTSPQCPCLQ